MPGRDNKGMPPHSDQRQYRQCESPQPLASLLSTSWNVERVGVERNISGGVDRCMLVPLGIESRKPSRKQKTRTEQAYTDTDIETDGGRMFRGWVNRFAASYLDGGTHPHCGAAEKANGHNEKNEIGLGER